MDVRGLGYLEIEASDVGAWRTYATDVVGLAVAGSSDEALYLKMDERPFRFVIVPGEADRLNSVGWEVPNEAALDAAEAELEAAGVAVERGTADEAAARRVRELIRFVDPGGSALELFCAPVQDHTLFVSPVGVSRFVTGQLGMGHIVLMTSAFEETLAFYTDVLGFRVSDWMMLGQMQLCFLHCNRRHHSVALGAADRSGLGHFMVEAGSIDDVGYALDRFQDHEIRIKQGLGRHSNDQMFSFYAATPGGFDIEFGYGGIEVDDLTWTSQEITKTSFWGHRRPPRVGG